jgi:glutamate N-acetyltransferase/amino-acid N-acetyltransferase
VHGGLKSRGRRDFALVVADKPAACAAAFTTNAAAAAPVIVAREHVVDGRVQVVMVNSGNANAGTGEKGLKFARWSCRELGNRLGVDAALVLPCSTGVIGVDLERVPFARAISLGVDGLSEKGFGAAARAIMASDAYPKWTHRTVRVGDVELRIAGMAKGAGMIRPDMATMLSVLVTDAHISSHALSSILDHALPRSFNRISVDGDMSTNDTVVLMASGKGAGEPIKGSESAAYEAVRDGFTDAMDELSRMIVRDGEGATKVVDVVVNGTEDDASAARGARAVAESTLLKAALAGADPNWGRIVCALGYSGIDFDQDRLTIEVDDVCLVRSGSLVSERAVRMARKVMRRDAYVLRLTIGKGRGNATVVTSDLTEAYVRFNTGYS